MSDKKSRLCDYDSFIIDAAVAQRKLPSSASRVDASISHAPREGRDIRRRTVLYACIQNNDHQRGQTIPVIWLYFLPRCIKCRRGLAMRKLSVRPPVRLSVCQTRVL